MGGAISTFGGLIVGCNIELIPEKRIVQAWRAVEDFPSGVYSVVKMEFAPKGSGTILMLDHTGFPEGHYDHLYEGWPPRLLGFVEEIPRLDAIRHAEVIIHWLTLRSLHERRPRRLRTTRGRRERRSLNSIATLSSVIVRKDTRRGAAVANSAGNSSATVRKGRPTISSSVGSTLANSPLAREENPLTRDRAASFGICSRPAVEVGSRSTTVQVIRHPTIALANAGIARKSKPSRSG